MSELMYVRVDFCDDPEMVDDPEYAIRMVGGAMTAADATTLAAELAEDPRFLVQTTPIYPLLSLANARKLARQHIDLG